MPLWRCPHCGTPQVESSRCWVCSRSTTCCATCRNFRRGIAGSLGLCGVDPRRIALTGREMRACWSAAEPAHAEAMDGARSPDPGPGGARRAERPARTFVLVAEREAGAPAVSAPSDRRGAAASPTVGATLRRIPGRWSLWGDLEG